MKSAYRLSKSAKGIEEEEGATLRCFHICITTKKDQCMSTVTQCARNKNLDHKIIYIGDNSSFKLKL